MEDNKKKSSNNNDQKPKMKHTVIILIIAGVISLMLMSLMSNMYENATTKQISYDEFLTMIEKEEIKEVVVSEEGKLLITPLKTEDSVVPFTYWTGQFEDLNELSVRLDEKDIKFSKTIKDSGNSLIDFILVWILPFALIYLVMGILFRKMSQGGGMMGVGKSNAKVYVQKETGITFKDVAGQEEAKESMTEIVDFLHNPEKYSKNL